MEMENKNFVCPAWMLRAIEEAIDRHSSPGPKLATEEGEEEEDGTIDHTSIRMDGGRSMRNNISSNVCVCT